MKVERRFTSDLTNGQEVSDLIDWKIVEAKIIDHNTGRVIFSIDNAEVPKGFNDTSVNVITSKYFRMTLVPTSDKYLTKIPEKTKNDRDIPEWLQRSQLTSKVASIYEDYRQIRNKISVIRDNPSDASEKHSKISSLESELEKISNDLKPYLANESSAKQVFHRLSGFWTYWGYKNEYFDTEEDAKAFYDECYYMLASQILAPNTPQWFNAGLYWAYGLETEPKSLWKYDPELDEVYQPDGFFKNPGLHACLEAGTPVSIINGLTKPIEDIMVGDEVVTGNNRLRKVVATSVRKVDEIVKLRVEYVGTIGCTTDHKWLAIKKDDVECVRGTNYCDDTSRGNKPHCNVLHRKYASDCTVIDAVVDPRMIESCDLEIGDYIKISGSRFGTGNVVLDLSKWSDDARLPHAHDLPKSLTVDKDLARLFGYYLAEGDSEKRGYVRFTISSNETDICDDILHLMKKYFGLEGSIQFHTTTNSLSIRYTSVRLASMFIDLFGDSALNKSIPHELFNMPEDETTGLIDGLIKGDGCLYKGNIRFGVVSKNLRDQLYALLLRFNCVGGLSKRSYTDEDKKNWNDLYYLCVRAQYTPLFENVDKQSNHVRIINGDAYIRIIDKNTIKSETEVYDFEVEDDHTFTVCGLTSSNCHINLSNDILIGEDGSIYDLLSAEAKAFSTGGGVGSNYSNIRSKYEKLSNGNTATGLMSFLDVFDKSAGVIKSGASQRRAAKMVIVDIDHPEVTDFIEWKANEEKKVDYLVAGGMSYAWDGDNSAYKTVSGQNSNNSVRLNKKFYDAVDNDSEWNMVARTTGEVVRTDKAKNIWNSIKKCAWESGDPGIQNDDIIQLWNTCPEDGRIRASNPCSEYLFLDDTSCNLASINVAKFFSNDCSKFDVDSFNHVCYLGMIILDVSIEAASLPTKALAKNTYLYRTTGLGHSNIGAVLMQAGIPYDSEKACHLMAGISALMTANAYYQSTIMAEDIGTFARYKNNKLSMQRVIENHADAASGNDIFGPMNNQTWKIDHNQLLPELSEAIRDVWSKTVTRGREHGYRNAFTTVIQPSGTVGFLLGCDTLAIEPEFSIIKYKSLSGGGAIKIVNNTVKNSLINLGYTGEQINDIMRYVLGSGSLVDAPYINVESLKEIGVVDDDIISISNSIKSVTELRHAIIPNLSDETLRNIGITRSKFSQVNIFKYMGFTKHQYIEANKFICGYGTLENAPHIKSEHLAIFDCANKNGYGDRYISWEAHVRAVSAVSPFISGAISKTINMPNNTSVDEIGQAYRMSYDGKGSNSYCPGGIKCMALYRDGSKRSQPLNNPSNMGWWDANDTDNKIYYRGDRRRPPRKRDAVVEEVVIYTDAGPRKMTVKFGEYVEGKLCEIWIETDNQNPDFFLACKWASRSMSNALQYGQPLSDMASSFIGSGGGPSGRTNHPYITYCDSVIDFVMKLAMLHYEGDTTYCRRKPSPDDIRYNRVTKYDGNGYTNGSTNGSSSNNGSVNGNGVELKRVLDTGQVRDNCPVCGASGDKIVKLPCPSCTACGTSLGGCSP